MEYIITAHSISTNQTQRELQLMGAQPNNSREAQRLADSFAARLNQRRALSVADWQGRVQSVDSNPYRTQ